MNGPPGNFELVIRVGPDVRYRSTVSLKSGDCTFDNLARALNGFVEALGLDHYAPHVIDYGAPTVQRWLLAIRWVTRGGAVPRW